MPITKTYASFFSGIGGLEGSKPAKSFCEIDKQAQSVLKRRFPNSLIHEDIRSVDKVDTDVIAGGWPCQDISIAGQGKGLSGANSSLFYHLLRIAVNSNCETIVAENVSNIRKLDNGRVFREVVREFFDAGYSYVAWREINAREVGLPHHRNRVFFVASANKRSALSLFRELPCTTKPKKDKEVSVAGFYWTAGTHSINYSKGYVPTIKVGSSLSIPSPPALHIGGRVRLLSPSEALKLQGFDSEFGILKRSGAYKMAGNAVAAPVGRFVVDGVLTEKPIPTFRTNGQLSLFEEDFIAGVGVVPSAGFFDGSLTEVITDRSIMATNLEDYVDFEDKTSISVRAATGLLKRLDRSGSSCPEDLRKDLNRIATQKPAI
jgi:DNA (cytosine-5)-methyltransferase 1